MGLVACPSTIGSYSPVEGRIVGAMYNLGVCRSYCDATVSPAHPICLGRPKHALTRYDCRCDLRLSYFGFGWLTLWC